MSVRATMSCGLLPPLFTQLSTCLRRSRWGQGLAVDGDGEFRHGAGLRAGEAARLNSRTTSPMAL